MLKVEADSLSAYFAFDPARKAELQKLDAATLAAMVAEIGEAFAAA